MNNSQKRWDIEKKSGGADDNVIVPVISLRRVNAQKFPEGSKQDSVGERPKIQDEQLHRDMLDYSFKTHRSQLMKKFWWQRSCDHPERSRLTNGRTKFNLQQIHST